jgi:geranylgeranyl diphosphate synthase type I
MTQSPNSAVKKRHSDAIGRVQKLIGNLVEGESWGVLRSITREYLNNHGRFFRARIVIEGGECLGVQADRSVPFAAACELVHNASLIHDDVQDKDGERRGQSALWVTHGFEQAITAGDLLLMLPFIALEHGGYTDAEKWRLSRCIASRAASTACGQAMEFAMLGAGGWSRAAYESAAQGKTGQLFAMAIEGANILADSPAESRVLADATLRLGTVFQIQDDVVDLYGDKGRCQKGGDLREGKVSALVVAHLANRSEDEEELLALLHQSAEETTDEQIDDWSKRFRESGTLDDVIGWGEDLLVELKNDVRLKGVPDLGDYLAGMGSSLLSRSYKSVGRRSKKGASSQDKSQAALRS